MSDPGKGVLRRLGWLLFAVVLALMLLWVWTGDRRWAATAGIIAVPMVVLAGAGHEDRRRGIR